MQHLEAQKLLEQHQLKLEEINVTPTLLDQEESLQCSLHHASRVEEYFWRQKSRSPWLQAGGIRTLATSTNKHRHGSNLTLSRDFNIKIKQSRILKESSRFPTSISKVYIPGIHQPKHKSIIIS